MITEAYRHKVLIEVGRNGLGFSPRLFSGWWFSVAAALPVLFFFVLFGFGKSSFHESLQVAWVFAELPLVSAALLGFTMGAAILDPKRVRHPWQAGLRGILVAALSYPLFMATWLLPGTLGLATKGTSEAQPEFSAVLMMFLLGAIFVGWLIVLAGFAAGVLLFALAQREAFRARVAGSGEVDPSLAK